MGKSINDKIQAVLLGLVVAMLLVLTSKTADAYLIMLGLGAELATILSIFISVFLIFSFGYLIIKLWDA